MKVQQVSPGIINKIKSLIARVGYLKSDIGIVEDTDTATHTISSGQYVIWKNELYKASAAIPSGDPLSSSNLTAVSDGIANELNSKITSIDYGSVSINNNVASGTGRVYKLGNWVVIFVNIITTGTIDTTTVIGTVPAGFRPNGTIEMHWEYQQPNNTYTSYNTYMTENTNGEIKQSATGSITIGSIIRIMHVYLIS